jgi:hypothetical protein
VYAVDTAGVFGGPMPHSRGALLRNEQYSYIRRMTSRSVSGIAIYRRRLLRIHGTILLLVALASAVATTIGRVTGTGPFGFMRQDPMVWVGLIQAYLLMGIIAALLVLGARDANARKWNVVGALAHGVPLIAALSSLDVLKSLGPLAIVRGAIAFHVVWLCLEGSAALLRDADPTSPPMK